MQLDLAWRVGSKLVLAGQGTTTQGEEFTTYLEVIMAWRGSTRLSIAQRNQS